MKLQVNVRGGEGHDFELGHFFSDEPGFYQNEEFGIRLETVLYVVEKQNMKHQDKGDYGPFYGFEPVCFVPFEPKLIDFSLFNQEQMDWFNRYNRLTRGKVGGELQRQGKTR